MDKERGGILTDRELETLVAGARGSIVEVDVGEDIFLRRSSERDDRRAERLTSTPTGRPRPTELRGTIPQGGQDSLFAERSCGADVPRSKAPAEYYDALRSAERAEQRWPDGDWEKAGGTGARERTPATELRESQKGSSWQELSDRFARLNGSKSTEMRPQEVPGQDPASPSGGSGVVTVPNRTTEETPAMVEKGQPTPSQAPVGRAEGDPGRGQEGPGAQPLGLGGTGAGIPDARGMAGSGPNSFQPNRMDGAEPPCDPGDGSATTRMGGGQENGCRGGPTNTGARKGSSGTVGMVTD